MSYVIVGIVCLVAGIFVHKYFADKANAEQAKLGAAVEQAKAAASQAVSDIKKI